MSYDTQNIAIPGGGLDRLTALYVTAGLARLTERERENLIQYVVAATAEARAYGFAEGYQAAVTAVADHAELLTAKPGACLTSH